MVAGFSASRDDVIPVRLRPASRSPGSPASMSSGCAGAVSARMAIRAVQQAYALLFEGEGEFAHARRRDRGRIRRRAGGREDHRVRSREAPAAAHAEQGSRPARRRCRVDAWPRHGPSRCRRPATRTTKARSRSSRAAGRSRSRSPMPSKRRGRRVVLFPVRGWADPAAVEKFKHHWLPLAKAGLFRRRARAEGCRDVVFVGTAAAAAAALAARSTG